MLYHSVAVLFASACAFADAFVDQAAGVKGVLLCGDRPLANTKVKLYDDDSGVDLDDLLAEGVTDSLGHFLLAGYTSELGTIDPKLNVYHDCDDGIKPCQRKVTFWIPKDFVSTGQHPKKFFDIGNVNMQTIFDGEGRDCFHRK